MPITKKFYDKTSNGKDVFEFVLSNDNGVYVHIIEYGASLTKIIVPDTGNNPTDVLLGYDKLSDYEKGTAYHGAFVGRVANRIKNGVFDLDGKTYNLIKNNGNNFLHGSLHRHVFSGEIQNDSLVLTGISEHGEDGFPGDLDITITYKLTNENAIVIDYIAHTNAPTILNLTNHSYFNLNGHDTGDIYKHTLMISADNYTPADEETCPTGEVISTLGTPMDFTSEKQIGKHINDEFNQLQMAKGYDHNYILNKAIGELALFACAKSDKSGIAMEMYTTQPGVQFYSGNFLENDSVKAGKNGANYNRHNGFCMETQHYPCSPSYSHFPSIELFPDDEYHHTTVYKFLL